MRIIDAEKLPVHKVSGRSVVYYSDILNAKEVEPRTKIVTSKNTIDKDWLLKEIYERLYYREVDGLLIRKLQEAFDKWERTRDEKSISD